MVPALGGDPMLLVPGGRNPRFSPDGRWIAYWTGRPDAALSRGSAAVFIIDAAGGQPRAIHPEMGAVFDPAWSPGSDRILVRGWKDSDSEADYDFWSLPIGAGEVIKSGGFPRLRKQGLIGILQLGAEWPLVWIGPNRSHALFESTQSDSSNLWEADLTKDGVFTSAPRRVTRGPGRQAHPTWAAGIDRERIAFSDQVVNYDIWTLAVDPSHGTPKGEMSRLTNTISTEWAPSISADGQQLLYITAASGAWGLELKDLKTGHARTLIASPTLLSSAALSGNGRRIAFTNKTFDLLTTSSAGGTQENVCSHCGTITGISHDGNLILYEPVKDEDLVAFDVKRRKVIQLASRPQSQWVLSGARFSPDEKWVAFHSIDGDAKTTRIWVAPVNLEQPVAQADWIPITDETSFARGPCWSSDGSALYFTAERDGFRCFWAQRLNANTRRPAGDPFALRHFHSARQSLRGLASEGHLVGPSSGANRVVFAFPELTGNIWLQETAHAK